MKKLLAAIVLGFTCFAGVFSQEVQPAPGPTPPGDADVVKISTNLIQIDVSVKDGNGRVITDLRPDEIEIYENGKKQKITNFSFVSAVKATAEKRDPVDKTAIPPPPGQLRPENIRRTIALVVDDLTLSMGSTESVRYALKKFVSEEMQEGDFVAIIRTAGGAGSLQQFTNDKKQLYAAIEKVRFTAFGGKVGVFEPLLAHDPLNRPVEQITAKLGPGDIEKDVNDLRQSVFVTGTLGAIKYVVGGMKDLPGRKSLILLSDGFRLSDDGRLLASLRRLIDATNRASVVIHTVDARGVVFPGLSAEDNTSGRSLENIETELAGRRSELLDTRDGISYLAAATGGTMIAGNNDLGHGIRKILDDQSYYLVAYEPDDDVFDPKLARFNRLEVKVSRPKSRVRYRSGFYGVSTEQIKRPAMNRGQLIGTALLSPFGVNDISLHLNALFNNDGATGSFIRSLLHVDASDLKLTDLPDGGKTATVEIFAAAYGADGAAVERISKGYEFKIGKDDVELFLKNGFVYDFRFPVKKPGAYRLRVALLDAGADKVGSANQFIEVPDVKKGRLMLSGMYLENFSVEEWNARYATPGGNAIKDKASDALRDTSLRQFRRGTVLKYGLNIFNAKPGVNGPPQLTLETRLFHNGKPLVADGPGPISQTNQPDLQRINLAGSLVIGVDVPPGDYVLQIIIRDDLAKEKHRVATQFVQFEVVD